MVSNEVIRSHRLRGNRTTVTCAGTEELRTFPPLLELSSLTLEELQAGVGGKGAEGN